MKSKSALKYVVLAAVTLLLAACGNNAEEIQAIAKSMNLSKQESAAFTICAKSMKSRMPLFINGDKAVQMSKVPLEVCACHSRQMAKTFKDDKLAGHMRFVMYISKVKRKPIFKLGRRDMRSAGDPAAAAKQLAVNLQNCANDYVASHADEAAGLLTPFELPKPKPKKVPGAEEKTPEKQADASH